MYFNYQEQAALKPLLFTDTQYQVLHDIQSILAVAHSAQELLSAEKTPTLSMALPVFEMLLNSWLHLQTQIPELAHHIGVGISMIQKYVSKGRKSRIYALAMSTFSLNCTFKHPLTSIYLVLNPTMKLEWIEEHWPANDAKQAQEWMLETVRLYISSHDRIKLILNHR